MAVNNGPVEEFVFEDWLRDGIRGVRRKIESRMEAKERSRFGTSEFRRHMHNARKEQLLAFRSLIDGAIEWLDKKEENAEQKA